MGVKDWIFGQKEVDPPPMTIQQFEQLLTKRRGKASGIITLKVGEEEYSLLKHEDYQRLIRLADAFADLVITLKEDSR